MDPIDQMLQGGDQSSVSPTGNEGQDTIKPIESSEEVEFSKLSGSAQDRVRELVRRANEAENKLASVQTQTYTPPAPSLPADEETALRTLSSKGVALKDDVTKEVSQATAQIRWELEQSRLMQQFSGQDGTPKYDPTEVEDYVKSHPEYAQTPRKLVFEAVMYPDEFAAAKSSTVTQPKGTQSLRPTRTQTRQNALTPEYIEDRLKQPDGDEWYASNLDEINRVVKNHTEQFKGVNFGGQ